MGMQGFGWLVRAGLCAVCASTTACAQTHVTDTSLRCQLRIIARFDAAADSNMIGALAQASGARLTIVSRLLPELYVLELSTAGAESACLTALGRVRADAHVSSAELDTRRGPNQH